MLAGTTKMGKVIQRRKSYLFSGGKLRRERASYEQHPPPLNSKLKKTPREYQCDPKNNLF